VPGTRNGYHGFTFGWTVGEMVRRASGKSLGALFQDEIAKPLGLDFWIGLPEAIEPRVAPMIPYIYKVAEAKTPFMVDLAKNRESPASLFFFNVGAWRTGGANSREGHAAEIGAANGITNARGLAGMYAPLAQGGGKLVDGSVFDSSYKRGEPAKFPLSGIIPCWKEALQLMKVGGKARIVCPSDLAYGDQGRPPIIPPGATLDFQIELLDVTPTAAAAAPPGMPPAQTSAPRHSASGTTSPPR